MARKTKGSSSSGSPRRGRPPEKKHANREGSSRASKPRAKTVSKTLSKATSKPPADDGGAEWVAPYHLRPPSRAALLAALPSLPAETQNAALEALERHLATFFAFKRAREFERHATPTGETRRRLEALRDAADGLAAAAAALDEEDRDRLGLARRGQKAPEPEGLFRALREVRAEIRDATTSPLGDLARFALSELSSETPQGRGPKPNLEASFLMRAAALVWEEFAGEPIARGWDDDPGSFLPFAHVVFGVAGVRLRGGPRAGEKLLERLRARTADLMTYTPIFVRPPVRQ